MRSAKPACGYAFLMAKLSKVLLCIFDKSNKNFPEKTAVFVPYPALITDNKDVPVYIPKEEDFDNGKND